MKKTEWIDSRAACMLLGVRPQTLYAYVSRHKIAVRANAKDARQSLYSKSDIESLSRQKSRPRARSEVAQATIKWGDPVLVTSISEVQDGTIRLRGRAIEECADIMELEQVAALLCNLENIPRPSISKSVIEQTAFSSAMKILVDEAEKASPIDGLNRAGFAGGSNL